MTDAWNGFALFVRGPPEPCLVVIATRWLGLLGLGAGHIPPENNNNNNNNIGTLKIESGWKPRLKKHVDIMLMLTVDNTVCASSVK